MKYTREFQSGFGNDPRNKWYAVYKCDACGHEEWVHMPMRSTFDRRPRTCPKCHSLGAEDLRNVLEAKKAELQAQEAKVRAEIDKVIAEIDRLPVAKEESCGGSPTQ